MRSSFGWLLVRLMELFRRRLRKPCCCGQGGAGEGGERGCQGARGSPPPPPPQALWGPGREAKGVPEGQGPPALPLPLKRRSGRGAWLSPSRNGPFPPKGSATWPSVGSAAFPAETPPGKTLAGSCPAPGDAHRLPGWGAAGRPKRPNWHPRPAPGRESPLATEDPPGSDPAIQWPSSTHPTLVQRS